MKVKIGNTSYDAKDVPIMITLTEQEKLHIQNMVPSALRYAHFPDEWTESEARDWMEDPGKPINNTPYLYEYLVNGRHLIHSKEQPPEDGYDEGTLKALYDVPMVVHNPTIANLEDESLGIVTKVLQVIREFFTKEDDYTRGYLYVVTAFAKGVRLETLEREVSIVDFTRFDLGMRHALQYYRRESNG